MATELPEKGTHENDVIFNMDSLREFIRLIKSQGSENIDFYAVSELLQTPGDNATIRMPTGKRDQNLESWKNLYMNQERQTAESRLQEAFGYNEVSGQIYTELPITIYQYIPAVYEEDYLEQNGRKYFSGTYHLKYNYVFEKVTSSENFCTEYVVRIDGDKNTNQLVENKSSSGFPAYDEIPQTINVPLSFLVKSKIDSNDNNTNYQMNYYLNMLDLVNNLNSNPIRIEDKNYYVSLPAFNNESYSEPKLFYVVNNSAIQEKIAAINNYFAYNKQIDTYAVEKLEDVYTIQTIRDYVEAQHGTLEPWWKYIYVKYRGSTISAYDASGNPSDYYKEFNSKELAQNPGKIVVVRKSHPWQQVLESSDNEISNWDDNIKSGRHLFIQAGSLLKFNPGQSTDDQELIDDYWTNTTPGTFSIDENNGQKAHIITIRGFDQNGNLINGESSITGNKESPYIETKYLYANTVIAPNIKINNLKDKNNSTGTSAQFLRGDNIWTNTLIGPLVLTGSNNTSLKLSAYGGQYGTQGTAEIWYNGTDASNTTYGPTNTIIIGSSCNVNLQAAKVFKAVFNDYAEYRQTINLTPGHAVIDNDDGSLSCTTKRLQPGAQIISDTFGDAMGYSKKCQTPLAVAGRVLVYTYQPRENYHAGMAVCSAPNGTVDIMTREEIKEYSDSIIGIVSEIPNYEKWGTDQVNVNNRIWIKIK